MRVRLRGGFYATDKRVDRLPEFDEMSKKFPIRPLLSAAATEPRSFTWACTPYLDQGTEGECVGYGIAHEAAAKPVVRQVDARVAHQFYLMAQKNDQWAGEDYEGSSVLGGMKGATQLGYYKEYRWAFGIEDVVLSIGYHGPVVLGINWYEDMFNPNSFGVIEPTGKLAGGHCILARGYNVKTGLIRLHNSWGPKWGQNGCAYIHEDKLGPLLKEDGEAAVPLIRLMAAKAAA